MEHAPGPRLAGANAVPGFRSNSTLGAKVRDYSLRELKLRQLPAYLLQAESRSLETEVSLQPAGTPLLDQGIGLIAL
jgi:hypothetical protein